MCTANEICTEYARTAIRVKTTQLIRRRGFSRSERPDIEQELMVYLLSQADRFDPSRSSLNTFVARVIDSGAATLVRNRKRLKRCPEKGVEIKSLALLVEQDDEPPTRLASLISPEDQERRTGTQSLSKAELFELVESVSAANAMMPPHLQAVCRSLMERNRTETARELNISRRELEAAIAVIRERYAQAGLKKSSSSAQSKPQTA